MKMSREMSDTSGQKVGAAPSIGPGFGAQAVGAVARTHTSASKVGFTPSQRKSVRGNIFAAAQEVVLGEQSKLVVVGAGAGGVPEMVQYMADDEVMWALLRFDFGSGAFTRTKIVFLHFNGEAAPTIRRGQANALTRTVTDFMRNQGKDNFHASIQFKTMAEVTVENIMGTVSEYFVVDSIAGSSTAVMLKEYHEQVAKEAAEAERKKQEEWERHKQIREDRKKQQLALTETFIAVSLPGARNPSDISENGKEEQKEMSPKSGGAPASLPPVLVPKAARMSMRNPLLLAQLSVESLKQVGSSGLWNWVLLGPDVEKLPMLGGGSGGVDEMRNTALANQDLVMYGLIRMTFEAGSMSQTRFAMLHVVGEDVPTVKRGRFNGLRPRMEKRLRDFANISAVIADLAPKDVTLETLLDKLGNVQDYLIAQTGSEGGSETKVSALRAYQESLIKEQTLAAQSKKPQPAQVLLQAIREDEVPEDMPEEVQQELKKLQTQTTMGSDEDEDEEEEEDDEDIIVEDQKAAPHADMRIEEVNELVRVQKVCNWALVRPRPKATTLPKTR